MLTRNSVLQYQYVYLIIPKTQKRCRIMKSLKISTEAGSGGTLPVLAVTMLAVAMFCTTAILPALDQRDRGSDLRSAGTVDPGSVIHPQLARVLADALPDQLIEVIVQFRPTMTTGDRAAAERAGVSVLSTYPTIHGMHGIGTADAIRELSTHPRVFWMENNTRLHYQMHHTTRVIEAVRTWNTNIIDSDGRLRQDRFGNHEHIDGTGVTVVVIDTGIDAGHPDFDYDSGKTRAYKYTGGQWVETRNSDTSSGHGTHCGGTVAGNGDASSGSRMGVAPGAGLIGLGVGDLLFINFGLEAFEWVYQHSRPGNNPLNIRVTSNSWGSAGAEYNPNDSVAQIILRLTEDNNVVSVFAAGNSGGDGSSIQTGPHSNIPLVIGVAALEHDGSGIASFSSRGNKDMPQTWPDVGIPGVDIWSTAPRDTLLDTILRNENPTDLYYIPMSGTSMACPHVAGVVALLYQAAPSLWIATYAHEDHESMDSQWTGPEGDRMDTMVTEAELILELTGRYLNGAQNGAQSGGYPSNAGTPHDWGQGHGLVDVNHAIVLALTLEELRNADNDGDGIPDGRSITVFDAYHALHGVDPRKGGMVGGPGAEYNDPVRTYEPLVGHTDSLRTNWKGDWAHFTDDSGSVGTDNTHYIYVPEGVVKANIGLEYSSVNIERNYVANIDLTLDATGDGAKNDLAPVAPVGDHKHYELTVTPDMTGRFWVFGMNGEAFGGNPVTGLAPEEFWEPLVAFRVGVVLVLGPGSHLVDDSTIEQEELDRYGMDQIHYARVSQLRLADPSPEYTNGTITLMKPHFNLTLVAFSPLPPSKDDDQDALDAVRNFFDDHPGPAALMLILVIVLVVVAFILGRRGQEEEEEEDVEGNDMEGHHHGDHDHDQAGDGDHGTGASPDPNVKWSDPGEDQDR